MAEQLIINPWTYVLAIAGLICITALLIYFVYDNRKRKENKPDRKPSPLVSALIAALVFGVLLVVLVLITGEMLRPAYLLIIPVIFLLAYMIQWSEVRKLRPLDKLVLLEKAWNEAYSNALAKPHKGDAFGSPILAYNTVTNRDQDPPFNILRHWLLRANIPEGIGFFYIAQSLTSGDIQKYIEGPDIKFIERFLGKEAAEKYDFEKAFIHESLKPDFSVDQQANGNGNQQETQTQTIESS